MIQSKRFATSALLCCVLAGACAHTTITGPGYPAHPASALDVCIALERGRANFALMGDSVNRCVEGPPGTVDDHPALLQEIARKCEPGQPEYDNLDKDMKAGRIAYDWDKLKACIAQGREARRGKSPWQIATTPRPPWVELDCAAILVPLRREGDECIGDLECPDGTTCAVADPRVQKFQCLRPAALGERCELRRCDASTICFHGRCESGPSVGEACDVAKGCLPGATCSETTHRCEIPKSEKDASGESCEKCDSGFSCLANRCVPIQSVAAGAACTEDMQCAGTCSSCNAAQASDGGRVCAPRGSTHDACARNSDCMYGLFCQPDASAPTPDGGLARGTCALPLSEGAHCTPQSQCAEGLVCDPVDGCTKPRLAGKSCHGSVCADPFVCLSGMCQPKPEGEGCFVGEGDQVIWQRNADVGETCVVEGDAGPSAECRSGLWCAHGTCQVLSTIGQPCTVSAQCTGKCLEPEHVCSAEPPRGGCNSRGDFSTYVPMAAALVFPRLYSRRMRALTRRLLAKASGRRG